MRVTTNETTTPMRRLHGSGRIDGVALYAYWELRDDWQKRLE